MGIIKTLSATIPTNQKIWNRFIAGKKMFFAVSDTKKALEHLGVVLNSSGIQLRGLRRAIEHVRPDKS